MLKHYRLGILLLGIIIGFVGCKDNATNTDPGDAPTIPQVQHQDAEVDLSFFQENEKEIAKNAILATDNYTNAKNTVTANATIFSSGQFYGSFLNPASSKQATFKDGVWQWSYSYQYEGQSVELRTTAEELESETQWATYWSFDDGQGNSYENYNVLNGTVSNDGTMGSWTFNILNPEGSDEIPALTSYWQIVSDTEKNLEMKFYNGSGTITTTYEYEENGADHTLRIIHSDGSGDNVTVYWNTDTSAGYIERAGSICNWDNQLQGDSCS